MTSLIARKKILTATVCALCSLPFAVTAGGFVDEPKSTTVSYGDLNMSTVDGLETLHRRLSLAAKQVCGTQSIIAVGLARATRNRQCHEDALDRAIAKVHNSVDVAVVVDAQLQQGS